jgi:hypothetical protein
MAGKFNQINLKIKNYFVVIVLCFIPLLFNKPIEKLIDQLLVSPVISHLNQGIITNIVFALTIVFFIYWWLFHNRKIRKNVDWDQLILMSIPSLYYLLYRFKLLGFSYWTFYPVHSKVYYFDIVLIYPITIGIYRLLFLFTKDLPPKIRLEYSLLPDNPINEIDNDDLNRREYAELVANCIINTECNGSFTIGINAPWGNGKTSFQNIVKRYLEKYEKQIITIDFNPWSGSNRKNITEFFFQLLSDELSRYDFKINRLINSYSNNLISIKEKWWTKLINDFFLLSGYSTQENINSSLRKIGRKVIVFIEDFDRLNSDEIIEILKLVRNSANFNNTFFVIGFDREYIKKELKQNNDYIDKIFQIQFELNHISTSTIYNYLYRKLLHVFPEYENDLKSIFGKQNNSLIDDRDTSYKLLEPITISSFLSNIRDVQRFTNFLLLSLSKISFEVVFYEYLSVSLIKYKYPLLARELLVNKPKYFYGKLGGQLYGNKSFNEVNIISLLKEIKISDNTINDSILEIIKKLFSTNSYFDIRSIKNDKIENYFDNALNDIPIKYSEINKIIYNNWNDNKVNVAAWVSENKSSYLIDFIGTIDFTYVIDSVNKFENVTKVLAYLINRKVLNSNYQFIKLFSDESLLIKLFKENNPIKKLFNDFFDKKTDCFLYTTFIIGNLLKAYINDEGFKFLLSKKELQDISVEALKEFVKEKKYFDSRAFDLFYYNCIDTINQETYETRLLDEANKTIRSYIERFPIDYFRFSIRPTIYPLEYIFEPFTDEYFKSWDEFKMFIENVDGNSEELDFLKEYFQKFESMNHQKFNLIDNLPYCLEIDKKTNTIVNKYFKDQTYEAFVKEIEKQV